MSTSEYEEKKLDELYEQRAQVEDWLMSLDVTSGFYVTDFSQNQRWAELDAEIDSLLGNEHKGSEEINEEKRLQYILASCDEQLERDHDNQWWIQFRVEAQERLEEIYSAQVVDEWADEMADYRNQQAAGIGL